MIVNLSYQILSCIKANSVNQNIIHKKSKLSMIWVKEYKGERAILVAK
jgi:hypothetical protein